MRGVTAGGRSSRTKQAQKIYDRSDDPDDNQDHEYRPKDHTEASPLVAAPHHVMSMIVLAKTLWDFSDLCHGSGGGRVEYARDHRANRPILEFHSATPFARHQR
jgi:hypothetical protein